MKKIFLASLFLLFFVFSGFSQTEGINWQTDFKKAQLAARESGRPLLLDFTASWCKPCQAMEKEFWVRDDVIAALKPFIAVKIDFDRDGKTVDKYRVTAIPFVVFADPLGNLVTFRRGFSKRNADELNQILGEMPKDFSPLKKFYDALEQNDDDGLALFQIANSYRLAKMLQLSNEFYKKALKTPEIRNDPEKRNNSYLALGLNYLNIKNYEESADILEDFLKLEPTGEPKETALYFLTLANAYNKKSKDADKYLQMLKTEFPASKNIAKAEAAVEAMKNQPKK